MDAVHYLDWSYAHEQAAATGTPIVLLIRDDGPDTAAQRAILDRAHMAYWLASRFVLAVEDVGGGVAESLGVTTAPAIVAFRHDGYEAGRLGGVQPEGAVRDLCVRAL